MCVCVCVCLCVCVQAAVTLAGVSLAGYFATSATLLYVGA